MRPNGLPLWATLPLFLTTALVATAQPPAQLPDIPTGIDFAPPSGEPLPTIEPSPLTTIPLVPGLEVPLVVAQCTSAVGRDCASVLYCKETGPDFDACRQCANSIAATRGIVTTPAICAACEALPDFYRSAWLSGYQEQANNIQAECTPENAWGKSSG